MWSTRRVVRKTGISGCDDLNLCTNDTFRRQVNKEHHIGESAFCDLQIDMVKSFPIDYMHQVCLGTMKKLLLLWKGGDRSVKHSQQQINLISERLINMSKNIHLFLHGNHDLWVKLTDGRLPSFDNFSYTLEFWLWMVSWSQKCINILWYYLLQCQFLYAPNSPKIMQIMPASFFNILYPEAVSYMVRSFWFIIFIQCSTLEKKFDNMAP